MAWIDETKAYDMILQSWILEYLKMFKISEQRFSFITRVMENRRVELETGRQTQAEVKIQIGIF